MLDEGDIVWVDFDPVRGREQGGVRPALVLTPAIFHEKRSTAIVCPITGNTAPWPTKVMLPDGIGVSGAVLAEQIRVVDRTNRGFRKVGTAPRATLYQVRRIIGDLLQINDTSGA